MGIAKTRTERSANDVTMDYTAAQAYSQEIIPEKNKYQPESERKRQSLTMLTHCKIIDLISQTKSS